MATEYMPDYQRWYMRFFISRFDVPDNTFEDPAILEPAKLGFITPKLSKLLNNALVWFVCGGTMVN
jgi:hypothetical protein